MAARDPGTELYPTAITWHERTWAYFRRILIATFASGRPRPSTTSPRIHPRFMDSR